LTRRQQRQTALVVASKGAASGGCADAIDGRRMSSHRGRDPVIGMRRKEK